jgi:hypothetical protein
MTDFIVKKTDASYKIVANRDNARIFEHVFRGLKTGDPSSASPNGLNPDLWIYPQDREETREDQWYATESVWLDYIKWNVAKLRAAGYTI